MGRIILPNGENTLSAIASPVRFAGLYRLRANKAKSGTLRADTGWMSNVITDFGLDALYFRSGPFYNIAVGTGSTPPTVADINMDQYLASRGIGVSISFLYSYGYVAANPPTPAYWVGTGSAQFGTGVAAGNLTEVGAWPYSLPSQANPGGSYGSNICSRALIVDSGGAPTSITVLSDEILTVTYQLRAYIDTADYPFTVNLNGSPITGTYRASTITSVRQGFLQGMGGNTGGIASFSTSGSDLVPLTAAPPTSAGATLSFVNYTNDIANSGTCYVDTMGTMGVSSGNYAGGIKSIRTYGPMHAIQFGALSSPIMKTSGQQLRVNARFAWGRYSP